jgi:hypothetical protein
VFVALWPVVASPQETPQRISVDWNKLVRVSKTTLTLQVVVNPPLRQGSAIHDPAWSSLRDLQADYVRFVPWFPYPRLGVAELEPPAAGHTSWDFSLMDPLVSDFFSATSGHPVMLNFSIIPQWMFRTEKPVAYSADPNEPAWSYEQGQELRDPTATEVADYYARLAGWYARGGFMDESAKFHPSSFHHKIALWEVLNEPDHEHAMSPQTYTRVYDAVVESVRKVLPETQFVGMSAAEPSNVPEFFEYFLNPANHKPGVPLDFISYHFYAVPGADEPPSAQQFSFFDQADKFLTTVRYIEAIRRRLSPNTKTAINEVGCILPDYAERVIPGVDPANIPDSYWNLCGAMYAYLYIELARQGIDILASSQLVGYPTQYPSVTLLDWNTGKPNARYWVLKLLRENFAPGDQLLDTDESSSQFHAQAFIAHDGVRKLLLVNKQDRPVELQIPGATGGRESHVDTKTASTPPPSSTLTADSLVLGPFSVSVLTLPHAP